MSISLDGFVAGPDQSRDNPLGVGGLELHHWHLDEPIHEADARARDELMKPRGAYVMGRSIRRERASLAVCLGVAAGHGDRQPDRRLAAADRRQGA